MRVYGLKSPAKSLGWLLGLIIFGLAILYPPVPRSGFSFYSFYASPTTLSTWYGLTTGGIGWHVIAYIRWQTIVNNPWTLRTMFTEFSPYCFVPVTLPISVIILWRKLVDEAVRPTIVRGVLTTLSALVCS
ncbi:MAG TPA: hypothetical protein VN729_02495, partial [Ktedonobacteraceae bacterium]|nr:hypothetical protein [Ktedonobacteraceae bacterium]